MQNKFRVASIKKSSTGTKIIFQVIGKSTFMECTPNEILSNDAFLECFSKKDIQKITTLQAQEEISGPQSRLLAPGDRAKAGATPDRGGILRFQGLCGPYRCPARRVFVSQRSLVWMLPAQPLEPW